VGMGSVIRMFEPQNEAPARRESGRRSVANEVRFRCPAREEMSETSCFVEKRGPSDKRPRQTRRAS